MEQQRLVEILIQVGVTAAIGLLGWSLRQTLIGLRAIVEQVATDVRQLSASVGVHESQLARGDVEIVELKRRVDGLEDRERRARAAGE